MEKACDVNNFIYKVNTKTSIINWMVDYNLLCSDSYIPNIMIYIFFGGCMLSCIFVTPLADRVGRKPFLVVIMLAYFVITINAITSGDYKSLIFVLIASGLFTGSFYNLAIMIMIESTTKEYRAIYATLVFSSLPIGGFLVPPLVEAFRDWKIVSAIVAVSALIFTISLIFLDDSPRYYLSKLNYEGAKSSANAICYWNSLKNYNKEIKELKLKENIQQMLKKRDAEPYNFGELLEYKSTAKAAYVMIVCSFIFNNMYLGMVLNSEQLLLSRYYNAMTTSLLDFVACIIAGMLLQKYGRQAIVGSFQYISCLMAIIMAFLSSLPERPHAIILIANRFFSLVVLNGGYLYAIECFPTRVRGKGIGLCSLFANAGKILAYLITNMGHTYTFIFGIIGLIGFYSLKWLPEVEDTGFHPLYDEIKEVEKVISVN
jgi:MFS family permease